MADRTSTSADESAPKKAAFYLARGVRTLGNQIGTVEWDKYYRQAKAKADATVRKVSGTTVPLEAELRHGEAFLRTTADMRSVLNRGDLITMANGETYMISPDEHDAFTATVISLKSPRGYHMGINCGESLSISTVQHNTPMAMPKVSVPTTMGGVLSAVETVGKGVVGMVGLGVQKASDLATMAGESAKAFEERARIFEEPIGTVAKPMAVGDRVVHVANETLQLGFPNAVLEEVLCGLEEIPDCVVSLKHDSSYAETSSALMATLNRGDTIVIQGEQFKVSSNPARRFHATQLPLDRNRVGPSVEQVPVFVAKRSIVCIQVPNCLVSLASGATTVEFLQTPPPAYFRVGGSVVIGGETYEIRDNVVTPPRSGISVTSVPVYIPKTPTPLEGTGTLKTGESTLETSANIMAKVKRGDMLQIGDDIYHVSTNPLKRLSATSIPLDKPNMAADVVHAPVLLYENAARVLKPGDSIKIGDHLFTVANEKDLPLTATSIPLDRFVETEIPAGVAVQFIGDRFLTASEKAAAVAHRAGAYKAPVGEFISIVRGSNVLFTDGDLRRLLKRGDEITIVGEVFHISTEPGSLYAKDCMALDRRYDGPTLTKGVSKGCHVITFEKGSRKCTVDVDATAYLAHGDRVHVCGEDYIISEVNGPSVTFETTRTKDSVFATPSLVPDCLVSLPTGSKYATTTSSLLGKVARGDVVMIGDETYRVSSLFFMRFTADQLPLESARLGPPVEMDDLYMAPYEGDLDVRVVASSDASRNVDYTIYKHGDRVTDYQSSAARDEIANRASSTKRKEQWTSLHQKASSKADYVRETYLAPGAEKVAGAALVAKEKWLEPGAEKLVGAAFVAKEKILEPGARKAAEAAMVAGGAAKTTYEKAAPGLETVSRKAAHLVADLKSGVEEGYGKSNK
ncbi:hypothetical protein SPRG_02051 [Saprolegnia parasitica CBS 223.65]|uniref:Uncharacterized protein n=1 Tax=Saprolegnia parasitica (strain CBS 223.65) TaxID=695850 RepID=A0A067D2K0_SAPPC|nr:hypothetical protein SPRG_02051 [Saprolegnia parasitica CBS 223.65]KDO33242.1 hypothetical protein SPRG_02051 [Saprolegnia parasitica CBS 223.65]|eukprot:XP_012195998.1 hypothetical protein SPRG_02051 [Saprolegnia parasitica CBS 223.65]